MTDTKPYTDEDVDVAGNIYADCAIAEDCHEWPDADTTMRAILDAVAPALIRRAKAEALREAARAAIDSGAVKSGDRLWTAWLEARADAVEAGA